MPTGLERQLTLSHLAVTVLSATLLVVLILGGYVVYLRTDWSARWAGETAAIFAEDLLYYHQEQGLAQLDPALSQSYVEGLVPPVDFMGDPVGATPSVPSVEEEMLAAEDALFAEWLFVLTPEGALLAGNYSSRYPSGAPIAVEPPPGLRIDALQSAQPREMYYTRRGEIYAGQAPLLDDEGQVLGWLYYQTSDSNALILASTARTLGWALLGAVLVAVVVSAGAGNLLARRFSSRLQQINQASAAFAAGRSDSRVDVRGDDEIAQLGAQFNRMADRIAGQMQELRQLAEHNAQLAEQASALAAVEERNRLARELHDAIKQQLFGMNLLAGSIRPLLAQDREAAQERLNQLSRMTGEVLEEMDAIIQQLRPASLADKGLAQALRTFALDWAEQTGVALDLRITQAQEIPIALEQALLRVAQEALSNVARHGDARTVALSLRYESDRVTLTIQDDGVGFNVAAARQSSSLGLRGMAERMAELKGSFSVDSRPGAGTTVAAQLPLGQKEARVV